MFEETVSKIAKLKAGDVHTIVLSTNNKVKKNNFSLCKQELWNINSKYYLMCITTVVVSHFNG